MCSSEHCAAFQAKDKVNVAQWNAWRSAVTDDFSQLSAVSHVSQDLDVTFTTTASAWPVTTSWTSKKTDVIWG